MAKRSILVLSVVWMVILIAGVSTSLTLMVCGISDTSEMVTSSSTNVLVTEEEYATIKRFQKLTWVLDTVEASYYVDVDEKTLVEGAVEGLLASLDDPYTFYYTPEEMLSASERHDGIYEGVGLQLIGDKEGYLTITRTFKDSPAFEAGLQSGDRILKINGVDVSAQTSKEMSVAIAMIRDALGATVHITVNRDGSLLEFDVTGRTIQINRVEYQMLEGQIGYIMLYEFMGDDVVGFEDALAYLEAQGAKALIVDVRSNPGGLLTDVVRIADLLLPEGLIVYTEDRNGLRESYYSDSNATALPLAVLTNGMSASASEILAGTVQDWGVGIIVGETTFGKGIVQTILSLRQDGSGMQLTTARYFTPSGRSIHGSGIEPDIVVSNGDFDFSMTLPDPDSDAQLRAAMDALEAQLAAP